MNFLRTTAAAVAVTLVASMAGAATYDFALTADTLGEGDWDAIVGAGGLSDGGITVNADANERYNGGGDLSAYLDAGNAGLGVCTTLDASGQCDPSNDDNAGLTGASGDPNDLSEFESLVLSFSELVSLTDIILRDMDHNLFGDGDSIFVQNGDTFALMYYTVGSSDLSVLGFATSWIFEAVHEPSADSNGTGDEVFKPFYISALTVTPVPVPAAGFLLLGGLGGLAALRRRKKAA